LYFALYSPFSIAKNFAFANGSLSLGKQICLVTAKNSCMAYAAIFFNHSYSLNIFNQK